MRTMIETVCMMLIAVIRLLVAPQELRLRRPVFVVACTKPSNQFPMRTTDKETLVDLLLPGR